MERWFEEANLHIIELPVTWRDDLPVYEGFIRELPTICSEGSSRKEMLRCLAEGYHEYLETKQINDEAEETTTSLLSIDELMKYYDGETFDGSQLPF